MEIKRDLYLNQLIERKQNGLIKVITGIRRCGKSYLLNTLFYDYLKNSGVDENHIIKFAFDSSVDLKSIGENIVTLEKEKRKVDPDKFMTYIQSTKRYYIQSAYSLPSEEKRSQEIRPFTRIDDSFKKIVITGDMSPTYYNDNGVLFMNIFDFLLKPDNLNL